MNNRRGESGAVLPLVAIALLALIGFLGLAIDGAFLIARKTQLQSTADATALACAIKNQTTPATCITGDNPTLFPAHNPQGFNVLATVPTTCPKPWQTKCVETVASTSWSTWFMKALGHNSISSQARSIAGRNNPCLLGLATSGNNVLFRMGNNETATVNCLIGSKSTAANSISQSGQGTALTTVGILTNGGVSGAVTSPSTTTYSTEILYDPYANLPAPPPASCTTLNVNTCTTVNPGNYCSLTLEPPNGCAMTLSPGQYNITSGVLDFNGKNNSLIRSTGASFYVTSGQVRLRGQGNVNITAWNYGNYAKLIFVQPLGNSSGIEVIGNGNYTLDGSLYAPSGNITINPSGPTTSGNLIANTITIENTITINDTSRIKLVQ